MALVYFGKNDQNVGDFEKCFIFAPTNLVTHH